MMVILVFVLMELICQSLEYIYSRECCIRFIDFDLMWCREEVKEQEKRDTPAVNNNIDSEKHELVAYHWSEFCACTLMWFWYTCSVEWFITPGMEESSKENTSQYVHTINVHCYDRCGNDVLFSNHLALCHLNTTHLMGTVSLSASWFMIIISCVL